MNRVKSWQWIRKAVFWLDENVERVGMHTFYSYLALIIFVEVCRRFIFKAQTSWGAPTAVHAFIWLSWLGCSYCIKNRIHLRFPTFRARMPYVGQFLSFLLDDLIWLLISAIVLVSSIKMLSLQIMFGQTIEGTDNIPQWLATLSVPVGFFLVVFRTIQDIFINIRKFKSKEAFF